MIPRCLTVTLLLVTVNCNRTTGPNPEEHTVRANISNTEVYVYETGISGDEETATITEQPDHYEISTINRDSKTNWEAVYRYKPESGFQGTDEVRIELKTGSSGANSNPEIQLVRIEITVD